MITPKNVDLKPKNLTITIRTGVAKIYPWPSVFFSVFFFPDTPIGKWLKGWLHYWETHERGSFPGIIEIPVMMWVQSLLWAMAKTFWKLGLLRFVMNPWNLADAFRSELHLHLFYLAPTNCMSRI